MVELSVLNLEKWVHSFVQNLSFHVSPICNKKMDKINFTCYVDADYHMNFELIAERYYKLLKDIAKKNALDVTDTQSVCCFIEKQTMFLDKYVYSENTLLLMYHHNHINKKIVQSIREIKINKNARERKAIVFKIESSKLKRETVDDYSHMCNTKSTRTVISDQKSEDPLLTKSRNICSKKLDVAKSITAYIRQKTVVNERYLQLYINDVEFMKNVHITLYIASKVIKTVINNIWLLLFPHPKTAFSLLSNINYNTLDEVQYHSNIPHFKRNKKRLDYQHTLMLCEHAILCLIEPSEKASVYIENNLSGVIQNYLLQEYVYHFDVTSNTKNYSALLILSEWAKSLVKHPNTIMLRTISAILRCNIRDILVLSHCSNDSCI
ncbi:hypothetical protein DMN91_005353 [Ooceraea biroi]|uniref:Uncharacterized protein n=1 Tax=Ooceraea biroi TaxID=2015173 RepID=A0A3L8DRK4_OOCBI|nr:uncharacterized protein LOC113562015 [Ooceraea biroi]RLU23075.1 hypothetical protein DMN91_005353 [Ooceraea biroi]